jgi:hypothetical protein
MKNIRLKPLYFPNDDILIQPPSFLHASDPIKDSSSRVYVSNLEEVKTILRGRRLKSVQNRQKSSQDSDQEGVLQLSDFKAPSSIRSPVSRRYTFKKSFSNSSQDQKSAKISPVKVEETPKFILSLQSIASREKGKEKELEQDLSKFTENNKGYEKSLNCRIEKLLIDLEEISEFLTQYKGKITDTQAEKVAEAKLYDVKMNEIMNKEAGHNLLIHSAKMKKRHSHDVSEERDHLLFKETIRKAKRDLHQSHIENTEKYSAALSNMHLFLEKRQAEKRACQKELKDLQESLVNFYCTNLKESMDLREDGIRWTIKSLWKMKQAVPVSAFPKFLDDESSHFLLVLSEKELETVSLNSRLAELREEIKKNRLNSSFSKRPWELYEIVKERLREIKQKSRALSVNYDSMFAQTSEFSTSRFDEIREIKMKLKENEKIVGGMTVEEVKRVVGNYRPENFKDIGISHVVRTLVGDKYKDFRKFARLKTVKDT